MRPENKDVIDYEAIGKRIRKIRVQRGFKTKELASMVNIEPSALSRIEGDRRRIGLTSLILIAQGLGVSLDYLVFGNIENERDPDAEYFSKLMKNCTEKEKEVILKMIKPAVELFDENRRENRRKNEKESDS